jgi:hypothetical protein
VPPSDLTRRSHRRPASAQISFLTDDSGVDSVARLRSLLRKAPAPCATGRLSTSSRELVAEPLAPAAQIAPLVREGMLEEFLAGEVLEIRVMDPALADALVG